jgi:hypothetical protein
LSRIGLAAGDKAPTPARGSFTIVVLPDTQIYSDRYPQNFEAQTRWIVEHKSRRNIACVLHLGDIVDNDVEPQWANARRAIDLLHGEVPYFMCTGNHDYDGDAATRKTHFNEYFPLSRFTDAKEFGGVYDREPDRLDNSFHRFQAGGRDWLVVSLEFGPREDVVRWANEVVASHPRHGAILITHAYTYHDDTRYDWHTKGLTQDYNVYTYGVAKAEGGVNDGEQLWRKLVTRHPNFLITLNGHVLGDGVGRLTTNGTAGQPVHQMLYNCQEKPNGGDGWLRLLEFQADGRTVEVYDYSPVLDQLNTSPDNRFQLKV